MRSLITLNATLDGTRTFVLIFNPLIAPGKSSPRSLKLRFSDPAKHFPETTAALKIYGDRPLRALNRQELPLKRFGCHSPRFRAGEKEPMFFASSLVSLARFFLLGRKIVASFWRSGGTGPLSPPRLRGTQVPLQPETPPGQGASPLTIPGPPVRTSAGGSIDPPGPPWEARASLWPSGYPKPAARDHYPSGPHPPVLLESPVKSSNFKNTVSP